MLLVNFDTRYFRL